MIADLRITVLAENTVRGADLLAEHGPAHCTGMRAASYFWSQLSSECFECSVGFIKHHYKRMEERR
jgi:metal-dependent hydrolase (beta-lactamase superfamily II)